MLIVAAGIWAYHNSLRGPFIFDDVPSILENPHIHHWWSIRDALFVSPHLPVQGRPVEVVTLAVNYAWDGLNVRGYHAVNLMLHIASALLLFTLLRRTFEDETLGDRFGPAGVWLAAVIALIWEVHPLQTESVTYVVQRSELLMGLFLLLTLYCTGRGSRSSRPGAWYVAAVVFCALGMGSKEVMVGAPLIVWLYDRVFLSSSVRELWRQRGRLYAGLAATWVMLAILVARTIHPATNFAIPGLSAWDYLKTEAGVIAYYLRLCFWPRPLVLDYYDWPIAWSLSDILVPAVVVLGLLAATVWAFRRQPRLGFLGAWFFLILAPTSSFLPNFGEVAAERRMYLPLASVVTLTVLGAYALGKRLFSKPQGVALASVAGGAVVVLLTILTIQRNQDYASALAIWQDTVEKRPNNPRAHSNLGYILAHAGRTQEAIDQYEQALRIDPNYALAHNNLGNTLAREGRTQEAVEHLEQALRINPDDANTHNDFGDALLQAGRGPAAIDQYEQALRLDPGFAEAHYNLAVALQKAGDLPGAIGHYEQALRIKPDYAEAQDNLGLALARTGRTQEAVEHLQQALRLKPGDAAFHNNLGNVLTRAGRMPEAIAQYQQALRLKPSDAAAHNNLGNALLATGDAAGAVAEFEQVLRLKPDFAETHYNLGAALEKLGRPSEAIPHYKEALRIKPDFAPARGALARAQSAP